MRLSLISFCFLAISITGAQEAMATKCLKPMTVSQLTEAFPIVVEGAVSSRIKANESGDSYNIKIEIKRVLKGKLKEKELSAIEHHDAAPVVKKNVYEVGKKYIFVLDRTDKKGPYEVILPADGCDSLPSIEK